jgi:dihydrofolate synthase/folylpolyglutamate synthase
MRFNSLPSWLEWLERQHFKNIDLGLERIAIVAERLGVTSFNANVITVAGTNGKGSFVAAASALLQAHGHRVATYTSPHIIAFNERITLNGQPVTDEQLLDAFNQVDICCQDISLTYFEFTTLAAFFIFQQQSFDDIILEVGLGGRLDAVNIITPNVAVITSIGLDHQDYLGNDRNSIAYEKCGILRAETPLYCAEIDPPQHLLEAIKNHSSKVINQDFLIEELETSWVLTLPHTKLKAITIINNGLSVPSQAAAICWLQDYLGEKFSVEKVKDTLNALLLAGRFQRFDDKGIVTILDVAHNTQAVDMLKARLSRLSLAKHGKRIAVFGMLADKDVEQIVTSLLNDFDAWFLGELDTPRACKTEVIASLLQSHQQYKVSCSKNIRQAYARAMSVCQPGDQIIAFGSFYVVSELLLKLSKL